VPRAGRHEGDVVVQQNGLVLLDLLAPHPVGDAEETAPGGRDSRKGGGGEGGVDPTDRPVPRGLKGPGI